MALTNKRRIFIEEYLECWNGAEAARRAGYKYPKRAASFLLTIPDLQEVIAKRIKEKAMGADEVLARLADQARASITNVIEPTGKRTFLIDTEKVAEFGQLIKKIKHTKYGVEIELYSSQQALELIGKHHGLFKERLDVTSGDRPIKGYVIISPEDWPQNGDE